MNKENLLLKLKLIPRHIWILMLIVLIGIFVRSFHFSDWLQFGPDQARDALVVKGVVEGGSSLPILGPIAGGTQFKLGPIVYYFQIAVASIFGTSPEVMGYPDLLFSILTIPLLFLFLKKYFSNNIALSLTALMSVSNFIVVNSRFASNPNSIPFFTLLFLMGLLGLMGGDKKLRWPIMVGAGMGVGIQLHTILIFVMPLVAVIIVGYLWKNKLFSWKSFAIVVSLVIILNIGQLKYELSTGGVNSKEFMIGLQNRSEVKDNVASKLFIVGSCAVAINTNFTSSLVGNEKCEDIFKFQPIKKGYLTRWFSKNVVDFLIAFVSLIVSIFGCFLLLKRMRKETNLSKKQFLGLIFLYGIVVLVVFVPVGREISLRYFIIVFFFPFVLLGLIFEEIYKRNYAKGRVFIYAVVLVLLLSHVIVNAKMAQRYLDGKVNDDQNSILGEDRPIAEFIVDNSGASKSAYFTGKKYYEKRFFPALNYLTQESGFDLTEIPEEISNTEDAIPIFYIAKTGAVDYRIGDRVDDGFVDKIGIFNNVTMIVLKNYAKK